MGRHEMIISERRQAWIGAGIVAAVVLTGVVALVMRSGHQVTGPAAPAHATADRSGVVDGDGPVTVAVWLDLDCTSCQELAELVAALDPLVADGTITRTYHPVALAGGSARLTASVACAADHDAHAAYLSALLASPGSTPVELTDDDLIHLAGQVGVINPAFAQCVRGERYRPWARHVTARAAADQVTTVPTVRVDRAVVEAAAAAVASAVTAAVAAGAVGG